MDDLQAGHYWKTPFVWEPGCPEPATTSRLKFEDVADGWLASAVELAMSTSLDNYDQHAVTESGAARAAADLLALAPACFEVPRGWWRVALDEQGNRVGFVLPVLFKGGKTWKDGRPEGTIFYMGVVPLYRGHGYAAELLAETVRICTNANCWRIFCDTGTDNHPMVQAFRRAGFKEGVRWQRSIAHVRIA